MIVITSLYCGPGFLLSRFIHERWKNYPVTWWFLSIVFLPIFVSYLSLFHLAWPVFILACAAMAIPMGYFLAPVIQRKRLSFPILQTGKQCNRGALILFIAVIALFAVMLLLPKRGLLVDAPPTIADDWSRVGMIVSVAFDLHDPRVSSAPSNPVVYHHFDYILPALVFRLTQLTANQAWYLHNAMSYIAVLSFFLLLSIRLFDAFIARVFFLFGVSFAGGGISAIVFRILNQPLDSEFEWWSDRIAHLNTGAHFQISSPYTLMLWVPHHFLAGVIAVLIAVLSFQKKQFVQLVVLPMLLAAIAGFSVFVFMTTFIAIVLLRVLQLLHSLAQKKSLRCLVFDTVIQAIVFAATGAAQFVRYLGMTAGDVAQGAAVLSQPPPLLSFYRLPDIPFIPGFIESVLQHALNAGATALFISAVDLGLIGLLGVSYFFLPNRTLFGSKQKEWTFLLAALVFVPWVVVLMKASTASNDMFMRGLIPFQLALLICASMFIDFLQKKTRMAHVLFILVVVLQSPEFFVEWRNKMWLAPAWPTSPMLEYLKREAPKDSVILTDMDCNWPGDTMIFRVNRVCSKFSDPAEINNEYPFKHMYVWSWTPIDNPRLSLLFDEGWAYLYSRK